MSRAATVVLLAVLSGAPAVALVCAELCAGDVAAAAADTSHASLPCHGASPAADLAVGGRPAPDCVTHGAPTLEALGSPSARISAFAPISTLLWGDPSLADPTTPVGRFEAAATHAPAPPPRPIPSFLVLRI